ncbi:MAG TPA: DUF4129 domain-containing protein [Natrialbaceae archaeon]|nr:DUF4129 domain-containing protein [Natrialbaceae archaeon]
MDRDALRTIALALLVLAVIAVAASTLDSNESVDSGGFGIGAGPPATGGQDGGSFGMDGEGGSGLPLAESFSEGSLSIDGVCIPFFLRAEGQLTLLLALVGLWVVLAKRKDRFLATSGTFLTAVFGGFMLLFVTDCGPSNPFDLAVPTSAGQKGGGGGSGGGLSGAVSAVSEPQVSPVLLVFGGIFVAILVAALVMSADQSSEDLEEQLIEEDSDESDDRPDLGAIGRVAGRAADRIDQAGSFENEVYRAWAEMTTELEVDRPRSSTPGEFASVAVEAGMTPDDVDRLTELFEEVRYGGRAPTADREQTAVETLRRIEAQYSDEGGEES